jgi:Zn-dependent protease with chaperone function
MQELMLQIITGLLIGIVSIFTFIMIMPPFPRVLEIPVHILPRVVVYYFLNIALRILPISCCAAAVFLSGALRYVFVDNQLLLVSTTILSFQIFAWLAQKMWVKQSELEPIDYPFPDDIFKKTHLNKRLIQNNISYFKGKPGCYAYTFGFFLGKPSIVIDPDWFKKLSPDAQYSLIGHEAGHVIRGDIVYSSLVVSSLQIFKNIESFLMTLAEMIVAAMGLPLYLGIVFLPFLFILLPLLWMTRLVIHLVIGFKKLSSFSAEILADTIAITHVGPEKFIKLMSELECSSQEPKKNVELIIRTVLKDNTVDENRSDIMESHPPTPHRILWAAHFMENLPVDIKKSISAKPDSLLNLFFHHKKRNFAIAVMFVSVFAASHNFHESVKYANSLQAKGNINIEIKPTSQETKYAGQ